MDHMYRIEIPEFYLPELGGLFDKEIFEHSPAMLFLYII